MTKRKMAGCLFMLLMICLTACGKQSESQVEESDLDTERVHIGITFDSFVLDRWLRDRDVFVSTARKLGAEVDVQNAGGDVEKQQKQIEKFVEEGVDTIVIISVDSYALKEQVDKARKAGIKVISYDRLIQETPTDLFITVDSTQVGILMGQEIKKCLPSGGKVVMVCGPETDANSFAISEGFEMEIQDSNLELVKKTHVESWNPENGFAAVTEAFDAVKEFDAVMCGNDGLAGYAIWALSEQQLAGKIVVVGQDADLEACQRIVEETQTMTVYKPIEELARMAAGYAVKLAEGEDLSEDELIHGAVKSINTGEQVLYCGLTPVAVTKENMDEVIIESGFHLRNEVYLNVE